MKNIDGITDDAAHDDDSFALQFARMFAQSWDECTIDAESVEAYLCFQKNTVPDE